jgi:heme-degrading monooxygenase HmoA
MPDDAAAKVAKFLEGRPNVEVMRIFRSAVHPDDLAEVTRLFEQDVRPAFESIEGCLTIELVMDHEVSSTGLIEGAVVSRWASLADMQKGVESEPALASQANIRRLLRSQPIVTVHLVVA